MPSESSIQGGPASPVPIGRHRSLSEGGAPSESPVTTPYLEPVRSCSGSEVFVLDHPSPEDVKVDYTVKLDHVPDDYVGPPSEMALSAPAIPVPSSMIGASHLVPSVPQIPAYNMGPMPMLAPPSDSQSQPINYRISPSCDLSGGDLPFHDLVTLRFFYNLGLEYFHMNCVVPIPQSNVASSGPPMVPPVPYPIYTSSGPVLPGYHPVMPPTPYQVAPSGELIPGRPLVDEEYTNGQCHDGGNNKLVKDNTSHPSDTDCQPQQPPPQPPPPTQLYHQTTLPPPHPNPSHPKGPWYSGAGQNRSERLIGQPPAVNQALGPASGVSEDEKRSAEVNNAVSGTPASVGKNTRDLQPTLCARPDEASSDCTSDGDTDKSVSHDSGCVSDASSGHEESPSRTSPPGRSPELCSPGQTTTTTGSHDDAGGDIPGNSGTGLDPYQDEELMELLRRPVYTRPPKHRTPGNKQKGANGNTKLVRPIKDIPPRFKKLLEAEAVAQAAALRKNQFEGAPLVRHAMMGRGRRHRSNQGNNYEQNVGAHPMAKFYPVNPGDQSAVHFNPNAQCFVPGEPYQGLGGGGSSVGGNGFGTGAGLIPAPPTQVAVLHGPAPNNADHSIIAVQDVKQQQQDIDTTQQNPDLTRPDSNPTQTNRSLSESSTSSAQSNPGKSVAIPDREPVLENRKRTDNGDGCRSDSGVGGAEVNGNYRDASGKSTPIEGVPHIKSTNATLPGKPSVNFPPGTRSGNLVNGSNLSEHSSANNVSVPPAGTLPSQVSQHANGVGGASVTIDAVDVGGGELLGVGAALVGGGGPSVGVGGASLGVGGVCANVSGASPGVGQPPVDMGAAPMRMAGPPPPMGVMPQMNGAVYYPYIQGPGPQVATGQGPLPPQGAQPAPPPPLY